MITIIPHLFQTLAQDGGEYRFMAGEFNLLNQVKPEEWDMMEKLIRSSNKKSKELGSK